MGTSCRCQLREKTSSKQGGRKGGQNGNATARKLEGEQREEAKNCKRRSTKA